MFVVCGTCAVHACMCVSSVHFLYTTHVLSVLLASYGQAMPTCQTNHPTQLYQYCSLQWSCLPMTTEHIPTIIVPSLDSFGACEHFGGFYTGGLGFGVVGQYGKALEVIATHVYMLLTG